MNRHRSGWLRRVMTGALLALGLTLVTAAASVAPSALPALHAQESARLASLEIDIFPELDRRAAALVILRGELAGEVPLPATVALRIPASSGGPLAVASAASQDASLVSRDYEITEAEDSLLLTLTTPDPLFQIELYDPLGIDSANRSYTYVWPGDLAVDRLTVAVQEPVGATELSIEPELGDGTVGPYQLVYRSAQMGPFELGKTLTVSVGYVKTDPRTSLEILGPGEAESDGGVPSWLILAVALAALAVIAGAVAVWRWQGRPAAAPAGDAQPARKGGATARGPGTRPDSQAFCTQCGDGLRPGDRFCSQCGAATRGE